MSTRGVALVTGARRGIGLAAAEALARRGLRVAITSRSAPGDPAVAGAAAAVARGAAVARAAVVEPTTGEGDGGQGSRVMAVQMDMGDRASIAAAVDCVTRRWGPISVLVNNALCDQPGSQAPVESMDIDAFEAMVVGEVVNTTYLTGLVLATWNPGSNPGPGPSVVTVGSGAAEHVPERPVGRGGWAYSYSATKAALHRLAPFLHLELGSQGVRAFTVDPGFVRTEALLERLGDVAGSAPPALPAEVIAWLALDPAADAYLGRRVRAREVAAALGWQFR